MPNPILAAVDPDRPDDAPLVLAAALARLTGAPLVAVAAFLHDPITNAVSGGRVDDELRAGVHAALERHAGPSGADLMVRGGSSPARVVHDAALELGARLVVVGSTHRGHLGRVAPGSTAERLLHGAPCPIAVAPAGLDADWTPRRIGVGFVDLEDAHGALRAAGVLAEAARAELRATSAVEPSVWSTSAVIEPYRGDGVVETACDSARRALDAGLDALPPAVAARGEVVVGRPAEALVALSREVDLLVCGSRGYGPARAVLTGSVTHAVLRGASCPVLVVPRGADNALSRPARTEATA